MLAGNVVEFPTFANQPAAAATRALARFLLWGLGGGCITRTCTKGAATVGDNDDLRPGFRSSSTDMPCPRSRLSSEGFDPNARGSASRFGQANGGKRRTDSRAYPACCLPADWSIRARGDRRRGSSHCLGVSHVNLATDYRITTYGPVAKPGCASLAGRFQTPAVLVRPGDNCATLITIPSSSSCGLQETRRLLPWTRNSI